VTVGRVSQAAGEVLLQAVPTARVTGTAAELLLQATPRARHGQQAIEVLRSVGNSGSPITRRPVIMIIPTT
jgi:hypothetical protein